MSRLLRKDTWKENVRCYVQPIVSLRDVKTKERDAGQSKVRVTFNGTICTERGFSTMESFALFKGLDIGSSKPTSIPNENVEVEIGSETLFGAYAKAFVAEARRVNPLRMEQIGLTVEEVEKYSQFLLERRIAFVNETCDNFRKLKSLYIPSFIQYNLAMVGKLILRDDGLTLIPVYVGPKTISLEKAYVISEKIGSLENDLQIVQDAMPRDVLGDVDVMSTALIAGYVRSIKPVEHVASTYVTAFLGMKLRQEAAFAVLYRVQYDDLNFISTALTTQKKLF